MGGGDRRGRQQMLARVERDEDTSAALPRRHVAGAREQREAGGAGEQPARVGRADDVVHALRAGFEIDQRRHRHAVAAPPGSDATGTV